MQIENMKLVQQDRELVRLKMGKLTILPQIGKIITIRKVIISPPQNWENNYKRKIYNP